MKVIKDQSFVSNSKSIWLDLLPNGLPDRRQFFGNITLLIKQCKKFNIPFVFVRNATNTVDNVDEQTLPDWKMMVACSGITWTTICSCQNPGAYGGASGALHLRKRYWCINMPGSHPGCTCHLQDKNKVHPQYIQSMWLSFMRVLVRKLIQVPSDHGYAVLLDKSVRAVSSDNNLHAGTPAPAAGSSVSQRLPDLQLIDSAPSGAGSIIAQEATAYPTESKEREKARKKAAKEAGIELVVKKQHKHVEDHYLMKTMIQFCWKISLLVQCFGAQSSLQDFTYLYLSMTTSRRCFWQQMLEARVLTVPKYVVAPDV